MIERSGVVVELGTASFGLTAMPYRLPRQLYARREPLPSFPLGSRRPPAAFRQPFTEDTAPTAFRLRHKMDDAGLHDDSFIDGLVRLIHSYASRSEPAAKPKRARVPVPSEREPRKAVKLA
jgi:hypothetical protein